jgi:hypothetical protein
MGKAKINGNGKGMEKEMQNEMGMENGRQKVKEMWKDGAGPWWVWQGGDVATELVKELVRGMVQ